MPPIFAITTRGLEDISAQEMRALPGLSAVRTAYRRVYAACDDWLEPLLDLRTVDDVFLHLADWEGIAATRAALDQITALSAALSLHEARARLADLRPLPQKPRFSVTANFVGARNYSADAIKAAVAAGITTSHGWPYTPDDAEADLNLRLFIEHTAAVVGLRVGQTALHRRAYRDAHLPGALKPPVAAAMILLAEAEPGMALLDPCCGTGTILAEAALLGLRACGGDADPLALAAAQSNTAGQQVALYRWDARALPLANRSVDCIVSNLPWGRQATVNAALADLYGAALAEMARVLRLGGRAVLLTGEAHLLPPNVLRLTRQVVISLYGQQPVVSVFMAR